MWHQSEFLPLSRPQLIIYIHIFIYFYLVYCPIKLCCSTCSVRHTSIFSEESSSITMQGQGHLSIHSSLCYLQRRADFHMWPSPFVSDTKNFVYLCEDKWSAVSGHAGAETSQSEHKNKKVLPIFSSVLSHFLPVDVQLVMCRFCWMDVLKRVWMVIRWYRVTQGHIEV